MRIFRLAFFLMISSYSFSQTDPVGSGRGMMFDGVNDYIDLGNIYDDMTLPITISAWVYFDPSTTTVSPIFATQDNGPTYNGFWFCASPTNFYIEYGDGQGEGGGEFRRGKSAPGNFIGGRWTHLAAVMVNANNIELYINGNNAGGSYSGSSSLPMASSFPTEVARIGRIYQNNILYLFNGKLDDVRIWNRALSVTEIREGMCKRLSGSEPGLIGNWDFDETTGSQVIDKSSNGFNGQLINGPARIYSGAPIGDESVYRYGTAWTGTVVSMTEDAHTLEVSDVKGNPQGVHIYTVRHTPSQTGGLDVSTLEAPYFGVFAAALDEGNTFDVSINDKRCDLYSRQDNSVAMWSSPDGPVSDILDRAEFIEGATVPDLDIDLGPDAELCPFVPRVFSPVTNPAGHQFLWQDGSTQPTFQASNYGVYWVRVDNGCHIAQDTITFTRQEIPFSIDLGEDRLLCPLESIVLSPLVNPTGFEFTWQDGSKQSSLQASNYGAYWVTIKGSCSIASDTIKIEKPEYTEFFIPNVITPNEDSKNQFFIIDQQLTGSYLSVYNRWGKQVYVSSDYQNNWDGDDLPPGMYFYYITNSCTENVKGYLSIIR